VTVGGTAQSEALFIGGRPGSGKSSVGREIHAQLSANRVRHCLIEGDALDTAWPTPTEYRFRIAEQNLAAMWANYRFAGYRRVIYTSTASVLGDVIGRLRAAMVDQPSVTAILLTCSDETARERLADDTEALERGDLLGRRLERLTPSWVRRVPTDGRSPSSIATEIIGLAAWAAEPPREPALGWYSDA
jgi:hypothetical protein